ncbi:MAG: hypothetical protein IPM54_00885 [Polyangiaceae bacterium]|nr:hypothetical protein [Polyangiaceae bacterium]
MESNREAARRKGLRMAAQLAAIGGLVAASAAAGTSQAQAAPGATESQAAGESQATAAEELGEALRIRSLPAMGCFPRWGPPAPPAMRPELFEQVAEAV